MVLRHAGHDGMEHRIAAHADAFGDEYVLGAAVRCVTREFAERPFGLVHVGPGKRFLPWTIFAIVAGFAFGSLVHFGFGLLPAMVSHGLVNFLNLRRIGDESDLFADD